MRNFKHLSILMALSLNPQVLSAETVIKRETVSFEGCLKVIEMTSEQSGLSPKLTIDTSDRRVAEFKAPDGVLLITCDRSAKTVTISTK